MTAPNNGATGPTRAANADRANADVPNGRAQKRTPPPFPIPPARIRCAEASSGTKDAYHSAEAPKIKTRLMITSLSRTL